MLAKDFSFGFNINYLKKEQLEMQKQLYDLVTLSIFTLKSSADAL